MNNWARSGVIIGIVLAMVAFMLAFTSEVTQGNPLVSVITGGIEYIIFVITVPLVYRAGKSVRKNPEIYGDEGLRIASWCIYGLCLTYAVSFFQWGIISGGDNLVPTGQITINGALLFISAMLMVGDTYKSHKQWLRRAKNSN